MTQADVTSALKLLDEVLELCRQLAAIHDRCSMEDDVCDRLLVGIVRCGIFLLQEPEFFSHGVIVRLRRFDALDLIARGSEQPVNGRAAALDDDTCEEQAYHHHEGATGKLLNLIHDIPFKD